MLCTAVTSSSFKSLWHELCLELTYYVSVQGLDHICPVVLQVGQCGLCVVMVRSWILTALSHTQADTQRTCRGLRTISNLQSLLTVVLVGWSVRVCVVMPRARPFRFAAELSKLQVVSAISKLTQIACVTLCCISAICGGPMGCQCQLPTHLNATFFCYEQGAAQGVGV